jgi:RPAP1-like, N-terminal
MDGGRERCGGEASTSVTVDRQEKRQEHSKLASSSTRPSTDGALRRKSRFLQNRMEIPPGENPAAKVIRRSSNTVSVPSTREASENNDLNVQPPSVLGDIVERKQVRSPEPLPSTQRVTIVENGRGFPSTHLPMGTFLRSKPPETKRHAQPSSIVSPPTVEPSLSALLETANRDAEQMLNQMTRQEIHEHQQELKSLLPPSVVEFMRARKKTSQVVGTNLNSVRQNDVVCHVPDNHLSVPSKQNVEGGPHVGNDLPRTIEKKKFFDMLASIQSVSDLDLAVERMTIQTIEQDQSSLPDFVSIRCAESIISDHEQFEIACDLLRSTVPRQALWAARYILSKLQRDWKNRSNSETMSVEPCEPYPTLLPVSLRCLLDGGPSTLSAPSPSTVLLRSYVLQSLYLLIRWYAPNDQIVNVDPAFSFGSLDTEVPVTASQVYCEFFMDDAVPTRPLSSVYPKLALIPVSNPNAVSGEPAAFTTTNAFATDKSGDYSSSSVSANEATADGESFRTDPMWILLTKMKMIPVLAKMIITPRDGPASRRGGVDQTEGQLNYGTTPEALVAISGILAMMAMRSPGAATAIAQHPTLLNDLIERTLAPLAQIDLSTASPITGSLQAIEITDRGTAGLDGAIGVVTLLCTLARQSRVAASTIADRFMDFVPPTLIIGTSLRPSTLRQYKLQQWSLILWRTLLRYGEGLPSFSTILTIATKELSRADPQHQAETSLLPEYFGCFTNILASLRALRRIPHDDSSLLTSEVASVLPHATQWLSSTIRIACQFIQPLQLAPFGDQLDASNLRLTTSSLRFVGSWIDLHGKGTLADRAAHSQRASGLSESELRLVVTSALNLINNPFIEDVFEIVAATLDAPWVSENVEYIQREAAACSFVDALVDMLLLLGCLSSSLEVTISKGLSELRRKFKKSVGIPKNPEQSTSITSWTALSRSRRGWLLQGHHAVLKILLRTSAGPYCENRIHPRAVAFQMLGRADLGDEALAMSLLTHEQFYVPSSVGDSESFFNVSQLFVKELVRTASDRTQLDHSIRLFGGEGETWSSSGSFGLESLLSLCSDPPTEPLLPMGDLWLWRTLAGSASAESVTVEAFDVLRSCLLLVLEFEETEELCASYSSRIPLGSRLYYVMTFCLQPEPILACEQLAKPAEKLLDIYATKLNRDGSPIQDLIASCVANSSSSASGSRASLTDSSTTDGVLQKDFFVPFQDFVDDWCKVFAEYGGQYVLFIRATRLFLRPCFPSAIRVAVVSKLHGSLHLLSIAEEGDDDLRMALKYTLTGGLSSTDGSSWDHPAVLDSFAGTLNFVNPVPPSESGNAKSVMYGFLTCLAFGSLVRHLAMLVRMSHDDTPHFSASQSDKQLFSRLRFPGEFELVVEGARSFLGTSGSVEDLVKVVMDATGEHTKGGLGVASKLDEKMLSQAFISLKSTSTEARE